MYIIFYTSLNTKESASQYSGTPPYGNLVIVATFLVPAKRPPTRPTPLLRQRLHSEIPTCTILCNFKPAMFIFPLF